ncbi:uncharacterized protein [Anabrus simplex]|uniref:uncharacterized protein n=1 Tax=Anabrus simplex TaxID=316456 RepID=UPI0035A36092
MNTIEHHMTSEKCFQTLDAINVPPKLKDCPFDGVRVLKRESVDVLAAWHGSLVLLSNISEEMKRSIHFEALKVDNKVRDVFSMGRHIFCFAADEMLYKLKKDEPERRLSSSDMFHSSSDHDSDEEQLSHFKSHSFKPLLELKNLVTVHPIWNGFVVLRKCFGKLFLIVYKESKSKGSFEERDSVQICFDFLEASSCIIISKSKKDLSLDLVNQLLKDAALHSVEILFLALGRGLVYYVAVSLEGRITSPVQLLYRTPDYITGLLCLPEAGSMSASISYLAVVLRSGPVMFISCDTVKKTLLYEMAYLPGVARTVCSVTSDILSSDGVDLWRSQMKRDVEEGNLSLDHLRLGVKGTLWLSAGPGTAQAIAATVHGALYMVQPNKGSGDTKVPSLPQHTLLSAQLQELNRLNQELIQEEELLTALNIAMRAKLFSGFFHMNVEVLDKQTSYVGYESEDKLVGDSLKNQFLFRISINNTSEVEFLSSVWMAHVSVSSKSGLISENTKKLESTFKKGVAFQSVIHASIPDLMGGVEVKCTFVCRMPEEASSCYGPWLIVPITSTRLDVAHFFCPHLVCRQGSSAISYEALLQAAQQNNRKFKATSSQEGTKQPKEEYTYIVKLPQGMKANEAWSAIFKDCLHRCSQEIKQLFEDHCQEDQSIFVDIGNSQVTLSLHNSRLTLQGEDLRMLHSVKSAVTSRLIAPSPAVLDNATISRALEIRDTIRVKKSMPSLQDMKTFRTEWRHFINESVPL